MQKMGLLNRVVILGAVSIFSGSLLAQAPDISKYFGADVDPATKARLQERITEINSNPAKAAEFAEAARHRTVLCKACHGEDGKSIKEQVPNIAGQNLDYMIDQMVRYRAGARYDAWMGSLAKGFTDDDIINIAIHFSRMPEVVAADGDPALVEQGRKIFADQCVNCHGTNGKGNEGYARLAGQRADYVVKILHGFKDHNGRRINPWMTAVSMRLNDEQIKAVASYISQLK